MRGAAWGLALGVVSVAAPSAEVVRVEVNPGQVEASNAFVDKLLALHARQIETRRWSATETTGGYKDLPGFYREVAYRDEHGRLLSRLQWERAQPDRLHAIEVYVYDGDGRLRHDYSAWFLPKFRNAPRETLINLYAEQGGVRGWRQFDGSGLRIYERCTRAGEVVIQLWEDQISRAEDDPKSVMQSDLYRACFGQLPLEVARYQTLE